MVSKAFVEKIMIGNREGGSMHIADDRRPAPRSRRQSRGTPRGRHFWSFITGTTARARVSASSSLMMPIRYRVAVAEDNGRGKPKNRYTWHFFTCAYSCCQSHQIVHLSWADGSEQLDLRRFSFLRSTWFEHGYDMINRFKIIWILQFCIKKVNKETIINL